MLDYALDDLTLERLLEALGPRRGRLGENILAFCRLLRTRGLDVTTGKVMDVCKSLGTIDLLRKEDFYHALQTNLTSCYKDLAKFDRAFCEFWDSVKVFEIWNALAQEGLPDGCGDESPDLIPQLQKRQVTIKEWVSDGSQEPEGEESIPGYSAEEVLTTKDFSAFDDEELKEVRRLLRQIAPKIATAISRRTKRDPSGPIIDLRRTMRANLKYGGEIMELAHRKRKVRRLKLVLLCDVSGSMDVYSRFLIQFIYGLQQELKGVETFVFSTRLTRVTDALRRRELTEALDQLAAVVPDWSGGTSIGGALHEFNEGPGRLLVDHRTVVMIISDGWDRGDTALLEREMKLLERRVFKILWLNPLLGSRNYQPLCKGMQAALPYLDYFLPAHNLATLMALGRTLETLAAA